MDEFVDVVDAASGEVIDARPRAEVHRDGLWHQVFHCLVVRPSGHSVVLQERAPSKLAFPGMLDLSVTGHLDAGETPLDGVREAEEELGVGIDRNALIPLGVRLLADNHSEGRNRERCHVYFLADDRPLDRYAPPPAEVSALVEIKTEKLLRVLTEGERPAPALRFDSSVASLSPTTVCRSDLVDGMSGYWLVLAVMAQRFLDTGQLPAI